METKSSKSARLSSVTAAVRVLKCFSEVETEIGISSLAKRLELAKSTVHRLAVTHGPAVFECAQRADWRDGSPGRDD